MKTAQPGPGGKQSIRRLEARGGVIVTTKDQTATGATGIFEMKTNTVTLSGGVVITQGANVLKGERLVVDLTTNFAKVEGGRVQGLFSTSKDDKPGGKDDKAAARMTRRHRTRSHPSGKSRRRCRRRRPTDPGSGAPLQPRFRQTMSVTGGR